MGKFKIVFDFLHPEDAFLWATKFKRYNVNKTKNVNAFKIWQGMNLILSKFIILLQ